MKQTLRIDALTDGVFAIVATLLVLDIRVPEISAGHGHQELLHSLAEALPSFIAFSFSFLTVMIYWLNHDHISKWLKHDDHTVRYLNLLLLFFICLIPFPTKFISMYPNETVAVMTYGLEMFLVAVTGTVLYWYIAFRGKLLDPAITMKTRKNFYKRSIGGPIMYFVAILISLLSTKISIAFYIIIPLLYVFLPKAELE